MQRYVAFLLALLLAACSTSPPEPPLPPPASVEVIQARAAPQGMAGQLTTLGPEVATQLKAWYDDTRSDCGGTGQPAFLCTGVMMRATETNPAFYPWDPSPISITKGGVSFSWLRRDHTFAGLVFGYQNGYFFYPTFDIPQGKNQGIKILCAYPVDAGTSYYRPTAQGCGPHTTDPVNSRPCLEQGIDTAQKWLAKYANSVSTINQCGWNVRQGAGNTAAWFKAALDSHQGLPERGAWRTHNEMMLSTWQTGTGATLPIRSFFYIAGNTQALFNARNDQVRYYAAYGQAIPIIRLTLPGSKTQGATFTYAEADQAVVEPEGPGHVVNFEDVNMGNYATVTSGGITFNLLGDKAMVEDRVSSPGFISGKYIRANFGIYFRPSGYRKVTLSWGCNVDCVMNVKDVKYQLTPVGHRGSFLVGRTTFDIQSGDTLTIVTPSNITGGEIIVLDNLRFE